MNLFKLWKPVRKIQIVRRDPFRLTPDEWRSDVELCNLARKMLSVPEVRMMLDTLRNAAYGWNMSPAMPLDERAIRSAVNEGYMLCLNEFENLAIPPETQATMPLPNFAPENRFVEEESI